MTLKLLRFGLYAMILIGLIDYFNVLDAIEAHLIELKVVIVFCTLAIVEVVKEDKYDN